MIIISINSSYCAVFVNVSVVMNLVLSVLLISYFKTCHIFSG